MVNHRTYIGNMIRKKRKALGMSQMQLSEKVGISYQQIQKYEKGQSEITISRLYQLAEILGINPISLLPPAEMMVAEPIPGYGKKGQKKVLRFPEEYVAEKDEILFLDLFRRIQDEKLKDGLLMLLRGAVEASERKR